MIKKTALSLFIIILAAMAFGDETTLTPARLAGSTWGNHPDLAAQERVGLFGGIFVQFKSDMTFAATLGPGQGGEYTFAGTFEIKNNKLTLYTITQDGKKTWIADGVLYYKNEGYPYPYYFIQFPKSFTSIGEKVFCPSPFNDFILLDLTTTHTQGNKIEFDGVQAIVFNASGKTTEVLNTRVSPSVNAQRKTFSTMQGLHSTIPKGSAIRILARTADKVKIGDVENYWYYIEYWPDDSGTVHAWVFAEYIKLE
ncbi:MAG: hypothetical protein EHM28_13685 [Spirochaetaceae bacterium]|nr:MAG: hypothetical protein EHM28_13685 [Spirochaetaceae bacterium]